MDLLEEYGINKDEIEEVEVQLDDNVPESMADIIRVGSVTVKTKDREVDIQELVDNMEFHSKEELIDYIKEQLGIDGITTDDIVENVN